MCLGYRNMIHETHLILRLWMFFHERSVCDTIDKRELEVIWKWGQWVYEIQSANFLSTICTQLSLSSSFTLSLKIYSVQFLGKWQIKIKKNSNKLFFLFRAQRPLNATLCYEDVVFLEEQNRTKKFLSKIKADYSVRTFHRFICIGTKTTWKFPHITAELLNQSIIKPTCLRKVKMKYTDL